VTAGPQAEAVELFASVLRDLTCPTRDLDLILRRCYLACDILRWTEQRDWFQRERAGYPADIPVPAHRRIHGQLVWRLPDEALLIATETVIAEQRYGRRVLPGDPETTLLEVRAPLASVQSCAQTGYSENTDQTHEAWSKAAQQRYTWRRRKEFSPAVFTSILFEIERIAFDFASQSYVLLRYGNALTDIWSDYRTAVDAAIRSLGFTQHLEAIEVGIQSDSAEQWRMAVYECRSLLDDLSRLLWQDERKTYDPIRVENKPLQVDRTRSDRFVNRLSAYLHQKSVREENRKFLQRQLELLHQSISALAAWQGDAHRGLSREDARSVALSTYFIVGEIAIKTDMQPVTEWVPPPVADA
jgi:hypothetical protein